MEFMYNMKGSPQESKTLVNGIRPILSDLLAIGIMLYTSVRRVHPFSNWRLHGQYTSEHEYFPFAAWFGEHIDMLSRDYAHKKSCFYYSKFVQNNGNYTHSPELKLATELLRLQIKSEEELLRSMREKGLL